MILALTRSVTQLWCRFARIFAPIWHLDARKRFMVDTRDGAVATLPTWQLWWALRFGPLKRSTMDEAVLCLDVLNRLLQCPSEEWAIERLKMLRRAHAEGERSKAP